MALAACYAPRAPEGAPCSDTEPCPPSQTCVAGSCQTSQAIVTDAVRASDGSATGDGPAPAGDRDGDGIPDDVDNCPDVPNPDQGNEDGDRFGDVCDPCPVVADDDPLDSDGDGVADACDPHPNTPGDQILLFEGFHHGLPASWTQSMVTASQAGDDLALTFAPATRGFVTPPIIAPTSGTVAMAVTVNALTGSADNDISVALPYDPADKGVTCQLYAAPQSTAHRLSLYDRTAKAELASGVFPWAVGTRYAVAITRAATTMFDCAGVQSGSPTVHATGTSSDTGSLVAIRGYAIDVHVAWLMVIGSP